MSENSVIIYYHIITQNIAVKFMQFTIRNIYLEKRIIRDCHFADNPEDQE